MPWSNQGGGGWRGGGPWGPGPQPSGPTPPDLEELLRRSQDRIRRVLPGGSVGGLGLLIAALVLLGVWAASGIYTVRPNEVGVVQRFGKYAYQTGPGLNYHWPYPIETALTPDVLERKTTTIGMRMIDDPRRPGTIRDVPEESLMLTGDEILQVQMLKVDPPAQVIDAFRDVQAARADQERVRNEAQAYANRVVPEARGEAARIVQQAEGYRERAVAEAQGQASRFLQVNQEYAKAPELTRERLYLETLERVLGGMDKTIVDPKLSGGTGVVPYLSLNPAEAKTAPAQTGRRQP